MNMSSELLFVRAVLVVAALNIGAVASAAQKTETGFLNRSITFKGAEYRYVVYVPREFTRIKSWPVILQLHGGGVYAMTGLSTLKEDWRVQFAITPNAFRR